MGYIDVAQSAGLPVSVTKGMWLYIIIAIPLIVMTIMTFLWAEYLSRRALLKKVEDLPLEKFAEV